MDCLELRTITVRTLTTWRTHEPSKYQDANRTTSVKHTTASDFCVISRSQFHNVTFTIKHANEHTTILVYLFTASIPLRQRHRSMEPSCGGG